jgi:hypothetical protein
MKVLVINDERRVVDWFSLAWKGWFQLLMYANLNQKDEHTYLFTAKANNDFLSLLNVTRPVSCERQWFSMYWEGGTLMVNPLGENIGIGGKQVSTVEQYLSYKCV